MRLSDSLERCYQTSKRLPSLVAALFCVTVPVFCERDLLRSTFGKRSELFYSEISPAAKRGALLIAVVATITLLARFYLRWEQSTSALAALSYMAQYFTLLTNTMTLVLMVWIASGRYVSPRVTRAVVIAIVCVGLFYHALLAHLVNLSGFELWADHGTHTFVPILSGFWWIFLAPKPRVRASDIPVWMAWPLIYSIYILVRANFSGFYPYPFLNLPELGLAGLATNVAGLMFAFVVVGLVLTGLGRVLSSKALREFPA